jgi:hypothetical protein
MFTRFKRAEAETSILDQYRLFMDVISLKEF